MYQAEALNLLVAVLRDSILHRGIQICSRRQSGVDRAARGAWRRVDKCGLQAGCVAWQISLWVVWVPHDASRSLTCKAALIGSLSSRLCTALANALASRPPCARVLATVSALVCARTCRGFLARDWLRTSCTNESKKRSTLHLSATAADPRFLPRVPTMADRYARWRVCLCIIMAGLGGEHTHVM